SGNNSAIVLRAPPLCASLSQAVAVAAASTASATAAYLPYRLVGVGHMLESILLRVFVPSSARPAGTTVKGETRGCLAAVATYVRDRNPSIAKTEKGGD